MMAVSPDARGAGLAWSLLLLVAPLQAAETAVPPLPASSLSSLLQVLFGLGLVLAAIAGTAWLLRRLAPGQIAGAGAMRVVGGVMVGPKERVVLVDVGETRLVLGVAPGQVNLLLEMPRPAGETPAAASPVAATPFYASLQKLMQRRGGE